MVVDVARGETFSSHCLVGGSDASRVMHMGDMWCGLEAIGWGRMGLSSIIGV